MPYPRAEREINAVKPEDHIALVIHFARKMGASRYVLDSEQFADGCLGLIRACQLYDPNRINPKTGKVAKFSTYAARAIIGAIHRVRKARMTQMRGGDNQALPFSDWGVHPESIPLPADDEPDPEDGIECNRLLRELDSRTASIVRRIVMEGRTLKEVGDCEGLSRERIRQIVAAGLDRIRQTQGLPPLLKYKRWSRAKAR